MVFHFFTVIIEVHYTIYMYIVETGLFSVSFFSIHFKVLGQPRFEFASSQQCRLVVAIIGPSYIF